MPWGRIDTEPAWAIRVSYPMPAGGVSFELCGGDYAAPDLVPISGLDGIELVDVVAHLAAIPSNPEEGTRGLVAVIAAAIRQRSHAALAAVPMQQG